MESSSAQHTMGNRYVGKIKGCRSRHWVTSLVFSSWSPGSLICEANPHNICLADSPSWPFFIRKISFIWELTATVSTTAFFEIGMPFRKFLFPNLCNRHTGNLRTLEVIRFDSPWCSLSLPTLTNLTLHGIPERPPLIEMLRVLAALEVLDMDDSLPLANDPVELFEPIVLTLLSYLCLPSTRDYKEVTNILSVIIVPETATVNFSVANLMFQTRNGS